ncbi:acyltransferase family protein [Enterobacter sp. CPE_E1214]|uniref:acyltransferase family protein n=1 Tax=unclassified Enterobacter TaxID=2608935 RepID=UPI00388D14BE
MIFFVHNLRGIAALIVVLTHLQIWMGDNEKNIQISKLLFSNGSFGVDLFFIISGFIICSATERHENNLCAKYIVRRIFRIYPVYIIALTFVYVAYSYQEPIQNYINALLMMQRDYGQLAPFFGYNMLYPAWTLSFELMFYTIFLVSMIISHSYRSLICSLFIVFSFFVLQLSLSGGVSLNAELTPAYSGDFAIPVIRMLSTPMLIEFVIGMVFFHVYKWMLNNRADFYKYIAVACIVSSLVLYLFYRTNNHGLSQRGLIATLMFLGFLLVDVNGVKLKSKILSFFGDISYSLYLSHVITIKIIVDLLDRLSMIEFKSGPLYMLFVLVICILVAYVSHRLIEIPFIKVGKKLVSKLN